MKFFTVIAASAAAYTAAADFTRCGIVAPPEALTVELDDAVESFTTNGRFANASYGQAGSIDTYVHVVTTKAREGDFSQAMINEQIAVMNDAYAPSGYSFNLIDTDFTVNKAWAAAEYGGPVELEMKKALRQGSYADLNLYFLSDLGGGLLGVCYFPVANPTKKDLNLDGCINLADSLPNGDATNYDLGYTAVHETGHWFGLFHVFQGGCNGKGDSVKDTPPQKVATSGCPATQDSCPGKKGLDSIHNFMDYSYDACMYEFTDDQITRLQGVYAQYRQGK